MEPVCFLCQEYEIDIGHETILCPKQFCKICQQKGHFAMNCKTFCKDFVIKDEQLVKLENEDEIHFDDLPCKVETKTENYTSVTKELIKTEKNCGEFSKSEEEALSYCLESISSKDTKKRKIDSDLIVENDLPLEKVQQKVIEKLNILNQLHQSEIKDLRQRMSKNALIIGKQSKELKFLIECKKELKIELDDIYSTFDVQRLKLRSQSCALKQHQSKIVEQSKDLNILREDKKKMELELNDKFTLETSRLNDIIGKQKKHIDTLLELKDKSMPPTDAKKKKVDSELPVEKVLPTLEEVQQKIIEKLSNDLVNLTESKGKMEKELNDKVQGKERLHQEKLNLETFKLNDLIGKLKNELQGFS